MTDEFKPTMQVVVVRKGELLKTLIENRDKHREVFERALVGYEKAVIAELQSRLRDARKGNRNAWKLIHLLEPEDHTPDYDRTIKMLEMSVHDTVHLTEQEFSQYVMDQWRWMNQFMTTATSYHAT